MSKEMKGQHGMRTRGLYIGNTALHLSRKEVEGDTVEIGGEAYYCIRNYDHMPSFFMNIVSSSDLWLFISSTGGLSAGRSNADSALFPYYTDDRISENNLNTGPVAIFHVGRGKRTYLWEPFSERYTGLYRVERNLYKNVMGDKLIFEEVNLDLKLSYRYAWRSSEKYGLVKTARLANRSRIPCRLTLLDGLQNLLPAGTTTLIQDTFSNLLNAYKRAELDAATGLGIFALSATMSDRAEPSEALKATVVWQVGLGRVRHLLCSEQVDAFRQGAGIVPETDVRGRRGAYLVQARLDLDGGEEREWSCVADVGRDHLNLASLLRFLKSGSRPVTAALEADIRAGTENLRAIVATADGLQQCGSAAKSAHHLSNVLFNTMRGGIFADQYRLQKKDLLDFISVRNRLMFQRFHQFFDGLPSVLTIQDLLARAAGTGSPDVERLCYEYLPLTFGRRHGDPTRPWNRFAINLKQSDGSRMLDYQGNWRDIFQNWEPLSWSFPEFTESMICKFLNATTADGYNPYRITRAGIDWEMPAPHDPWANIG